VTLCAPPEPAIAKSPSAASARLASAALIALFLAAALISRLCYLTKPFDPDGAMFIYMGKLVAAGGRIGCELIDNKFPTVGLITSASWRAFGSHWSAYVILQAALALATAAMLARAAARNIGSHAALPTALFALVYLNFNFAVFGGFQLETLQAFFAVLSASAAIEAIGTDDPRDSFLAGLAAGVAAMVKPSGLAVLAAFLAAVLFRNRYFLRHTLAALAGLALPALATLLYLHAAGLLPVLPQIWRQISGYAANSPWEPWDLSKPIVVLVLAGFPFLVRAFIFRRRQHRLGNNSIAPRAKTIRTIAFFALAWLLLEAAGVAAQRRMYAYHFLTLAAPLSLLFGLIPRSARPGPLAAALALPAILSLVGAASVFADAKTNLVPSPAETYLAAHAPPGQSVWMDNMMRLLVQTDLAPGSRYPMTFLWVNDDTAPLRYCADMLQDFHARQPLFIVLPTNFDATVAFVAGHIKELGLRPQRKANFIAACNLLHDYVLHNYVPEAQCGRDTIYRRSP
jgi:hypothetical protein